MLKDNRALIYGGGLIAGAAVLATVTHSDGAVCIDNHLMCAPLPIQMGDLPSEDRPQAPEPGRLLTVAGSTVAFTGTGYHPIYASRII